MTSKKIISLFPVIVFFPEILDPTCGFVWSLLVIEVVLTNDSGSWSDWLRQWEYLHKCLVKIRKTFSKILSLRFYRPVSLIGNSTKQFVFPKAAVPNRRLVLKLSFEFANALPLDWVVSSIQGLSSMTLLNARPIRLQIDYVFGPYPVFYWLIHTLLFARNYLDLQNGNVC